MKPTKREIGLLVIVVMVVTWVVIQFYTVSSNQVWAMDVIVDYHPILIYLLIGFIGGYWCGIKES